VLAPLVWATPADKGKISLDRSVEVPMRLAIAALAILSLTSGCFSASFMNQQDWKTLAEEAEAGNEEARSAKSSYDLSQAMYGMFGGFLLGGAVVLAVGAAVSAEDPDTADLLMPMGGAFMGVSLIPLAIAIPLDYGASRKAKAWKEGIGSGKPVTTHATKGLYGRLVRDWRGGFRFVRAEDGQS